MGATIHNMQAKRRRIRVGVTIDREVWNSFTEWAEKFGMSASRLIEVSMKAQMKIDKVPMTEMMDGLFRDLVLASDGLSDGEKKELLEKVENDR